MAAKASRLVDDLTRHLRNRILAGEFAAGSRISESGLAADYGVARPTARSAADALVSDGLLERAAYSALTVVSIAERDTPQILAVLEFVERLAVDEMLRATPDLRDLKRAGSASLLMALHAIVAAAGSPRLTWIHRRTTFEFILALREHGDGAEPPAAEPTQFLSFAESILRDDGDDARLRLAQFQAERRAMLPQRHTTAVPSHS